MTEENITTEGADCLPVTKFHLGLERAVIKLNGRVKHCGRSAFAHLRAAWKIKNIDPAMSAFRAITAEEEAASALLLSLIEKRYPGAEHLKYRDHVQKTALTHFINAVRKVLGAIDFASPSVRLHDTTPPSISVHVDMRKIGVKTPEPLFASPDQPLNFSIALGSNHQNAHRFEEELREIANDRGLREMIDLIRDEVNQRNRLLYAGETGIPHIEFRDGFLLERQRRVSVLLILTIAIQQTPMHQLFAVQCLQSFLLALRKIEAANFDFKPPPLTNGPAVEVRMEPGQEPKASFGWRATIPFSATFGYGLSEIPLSAKTNIDTTS